MKTLRLYLKSSVYLPNVGQVNMVDCGDKHRNLVIVEQPDGYLLSPTKDSEIHWLVDDSGRPVSNPRDATGIWNIKIPTSNVASTMVMAPKVKAK